MRSSPKRLTLCSKHQTSLSVDQMPIYKDQLDRKGLRWSLIPMWDDIMKMKYASDHDRYGIRVVAVHTNSEGPCTQFTSLALRTRWAIIIRFATTTGPVIFGPLGCVFAAWANEETMEVTLVISGCGVVFPQADREDLTCVDICIHGTTILRRP